MTRLGWQLERDEKEAKLPHPLLDVLTFLVMSK
jgi:hypothetical protein